MSDREGATGETVRSGHHRALPGKAGPGGAPTEEAGFLTLEFQVCSLSNAFLEFLQKRRCGRSQEIASVWRFELKPEFRKGSPTGVGAVGTGAAGGEGTSGSCRDLCRTVSISPRCRGCSLTCPMAVRVQGGYGG